VLGLLGVPVQTMDSNDLTHDRRGLFEKPCPWPTSDCLENGLKLHIENCKSICGRDLDEQGIHKVIPFSPGTYRLVVPGHPGEPLPLLKRGYKVSVQRKSVGRVGKILPRRLPVLSGLPRQAY